MCSKKNMIIFQITIFFAIIFQAMHVHAYRYLDCYGQKLKWRSADIPIQIHASKKGFIPDGAYAKSLELALQRWYDNPSKAYFSKSVIYNDSYVSLANFENEIWFSDLSSKKSDGPVASTFNRKICTPTVAKIIATDVIFNDQYQYVTSDKKEDLFYYHGSRSSFSNPLIHEFGHSLGLQHEDRFYNVMGIEPFFNTNSYYAKSYVGEDASRGMIDLYGKIGLNQWHDLSVAHFKYKGIYKVEGQVNYSTHQFTTLYSKSGTPLSSDLDYEKKYWVDAGESYKVEFTYENNGAYDLSGIDVYFYLSTNNYITTSDVLLLKKSFTLKQDIPATVKTEITIPPGYAKGDYWLGVIIDPNNKITERREDNNATYLPIHIK